MVGGFACARCDQLFREGPERCPACAHEEVEALTFSEYRRRRRAGDEPWTEPSLQRSRLRTALLVVAALGLVVVGLAAIGLGATAMGVPF